MWQQYIWHSNWIECAVHHSIEDMFAIALMIGKWTFVLCIFFSLSLSLVAVVVISLGKKFDLFVCSMQYRWNGTTHQILLFISSQFCVFFFIYFFSTFVYCHITVNTNATAINDDMYWIGSMSDCKFDQLVHLPFFFSCFFCFAYCWYIVHTERRIMLELSMENCGFSLW